MTLFKYDVQNTSFRSNKNITFSNSQLEEIYGLLYLPTTM